MSETLLQKEFNEWFKRLKPLPPDRYSRTVQIAKELADGVSRGFWRADIIASGVTSDPVYKRKHRFWYERISTVNTSDKESTTERSAMQESLQSAGYVEDSQRDLRITPAAFALLRKPTRIEKIDRWQTGIEIALVLIFLAHFLVLLPPAIESVQRLGILPK